QTKQSDIDLMFIVPDEAEEILEMAKEVFDSRSGTD
ncbi:MAG: hypothetical protein UT63_C0039G0010, partial [Candidatus Gottesmanbacteria bacterium GW2011_GWC2_39_8]